MEEDQSFEQQADALRSSLGRFESGSLGSNRERTPFQGGLNQGGEDPALQVPVPPEEAPQEEVLQETAPELEPLEVVPPASIEPAPIVFEEAPPAPDPRLEDPPLAPASVPGIEITEPPVAAAPISPPSQEAPQAAERPKATTPPSGLMTASGKPLGDVLPSEDEVKRVIEEPEEEINVEEFIRDLGDEDLPYSSEEAPLGETGVRPGAFSPRSDDSRAERQKLLDIARNDQSNVYEATERSARHVDLVGEGAQEFQQASAATIKVLNALFASNDCSEIHGNGPDSLFVRYKGKRMGVRAQFTSEKEYNGYLKNLVDRAETLQTWDELRELARGVVRLSDGSSLTLTFPPLTKYTNFSVRKHTAQNWDFRRLVENGTMNNSMGEFLKLCAASRVNMIIAGELGAGKTTLLSMLTQFIPDGERVALIQEVNEIFTNKPDTVRFTYSPMAFDNKATLDKIIDTALYMRFDRIIVGEIHDKGIFYLLKAMRTGSNGSMSTFHAGSGREVLEMLNNHLIMEHPNFNSVTAANYIRRAVDLIVVTEHIGNQHRVTEISEVDWRPASGNQPDQIALNPLWEFKSESGLEGKHVSRGRPDDDPVTGRIARRVRKAGGEMDPRWFSASELNASTAARRRRR